jgi:flagellar basal body-associated protein FliL
MKILIVSAIVVFIVALIVYCCVAISGRSNVDTDQWGKP